MFRLGAIITILLAWLIPGAKALCQTNQQDSLALVNFYQNTNGPGWATNSNWLTGKVDTWYGVSVSGGRVTDIFINGNGMTGAVPASLGKFVGIGHTCFVWKSTERHYSAEITNWPAMVRHP